MVTMQKQGEANIQTFSLPLIVLAGDELDGMRQDRVHDTGLLDVTVKYQQVRSGQVTGAHAARNEKDNHVCLSLQVFQACGLKVIYVQFAWATFDVCSLVGSNQASNAHMQVHKHIYLQYASTQASKQASLQFKWPVKSKNCER